MAVEWSKAPDKLFDEVEKDVIKQLDKKYRTKVLKVWRGIIKKTPVDTGRARSNWFATISAPHNGSAVEAGRVPELSSVNVEQATFKTYFLTNHLPYIERLEFGWSRVQAPGGMIRLTFAEQGLS